MDRMKTRTNRIVMGERTARKAPQSKRTPECEARAGGRRKATKTSESSKPGNAAHAVRGSPQRPETAENKVGPSANPSVPELIKMAMARPRLRVTPEVALAAACG